MWIVPTEGYSLIDPTSGVIVPAEGMEVPDGDLFWIRRLRDGDCTEGTAPEAEEAAPPDPDEPRAGKEA